MQRIHYRKHSLLLLIARCIAAVACCAVKYNILCIIFDLGPFFRYISSSCACLVIIMDRMRAHISSIAFFTLCSSSARCLFSILFLLFFFHLRSNKIFSAILWPSSAHKVRCLCRSMNARVVC